MGNEHRKNLIDPILTLNVDYESVSFDIWLANPKRDKTRYNHDDPFWKWSDTRRLKLRELVSGLIIMGDLESLKVIWKEAFPSWEGETSISPNDVTYVVNMGRWDILKFFIFAGAGRYEKFKVTVSEPGDRRYGSSRSRSRPPAPTTNDSQPLGFTPVASASLGNDETIQEIPQWSVTPFYELSPRELYSIQLKRTLDMLLQAGFLIGMAGDNFMEALYKFLLEKENHVIDYLGEQGALDSVEFGRKMMIMRWRANRMGRKSDIDEQRAAALTMRTIILEAAYENFYQLLHHIQKTGINIYEITKSQCLVYSTRSSFQDTSLCLLDHFKIIPTSDDLSPIVKNCLQERHYDVLTRLFEYTYFTPTIFAMTFLDVLDDWIVHSKVTVTEDRHIKGLSWFVKMGIGLNRLMMVIGFCFGDGGFKVLRDACKDVVDSCVILGKDQLIEFFGRVGVLGFVDGTGVGLKNVASTVRFSTFIADIASARDGDAANTTKFEFQFSVGGVGSAVQAGVFGGFSAGPVKDGGIGSKEVAKPRSSFRSLSLRKESLQDWYERRKFRLEFVRNGGEDVKEMGMNISAIREKIIHAVQLGALDLLQLMWAFAYNSDDSSSSHKVGILANQVVTAVKLKRFDILDFFIKSGKCCWSHQRYRRAIDNLDGAYEDEDDDEGDLEEDSYYDENGPHHSVTVSPVVDNALMGLVAMEMEFETSDIHFLEYMLALGASLNNASLLLDQFVNTMHWKPIFDRVVQAGFHISLANESFIKSLSGMLLNGKFHITEYLWERGVLDSLEFGTRIVTLLRNEKVQKRSKKQHSISAPVYFDPDKDIINWTMEDVIVNATFFNHNQLLQHLQMTGTNIHEIGGSQTLVAATSSSFETTSIWLLGNVNIIPSDQDLPSIINNCITYNHYKVLTLLLDRYHVTSTALGMRLLDALDEWISSSKVTFSEACICDGINWLCNSKYWKSIEIEGFTDLVMSKAVEAGYFSLLDDIVSCLGGSGVKQIDLSPVERMLAEGGELKFSNLSLDKIKDLSTCKQVLEICVRAGFHIGVASDGFVQSLYHMLTEENVEIVDTLWKLGALDSFEFGRRVVSLFKKKDADVQNARRRVVLVRVTT
ncbi:hypothetical protein HDU76_001089 [Blyttiomyces sp. JEL0837]|nr:hypothetical protein HDU76_001089 [Blyttiomyces sp. JEL0837]